MKDKAIQDMIGTDNHCHGCGAGNPKGLMIKSYLHGEEAEARWIPSPHHCAGSPEWVNGGIIASLMDCHSNNLSEALAYRRGGREVGKDPKISCVTAKITLEFLKPAPIKEALVLRARPHTREGRKTWIRCELFSGDTLCAKSESLHIEIRREG